MSGADGSTATATVDRAERMRRAIAAAVTQSWTTIPHFAVSREVGADALLARVADARAQTPGVTITDLLLKAVAEAAEVDVVGLSIATDRGVMNVSLAGVASSELPELAARRKGLVTRTRELALRRGDLDPVEVTLSNLGTHGVHWFTGIVPVGTTLLLTVGAIRPVEGERRFWATLNADHRTVDGAHAAHFLDRFSGGCEA